MTRRELLTTIGGGFGMVGLQGLLGAETATDPLAPKPPHFAPKAKRVIYLFLNGGPSQVDTSIPSRCWTSITASRCRRGNLKTERKTGNLLRSPFQVQALRARAASRSARSSRRSGR